MPVITISRSYGSGGSEVAARVARTLGWSLLDNAIIEAVADRLGATAADVEAREERVPSLVERLADAMALGSPQMLPSVAGGSLPPDEARLLDMTHRIMEEAVAHGPVVVVGRGAQAALASHTDALHVFCDAPREACVARVTTRLGVGEHEAQRAIDDTNRQREQYARRYFHRSWRSPETYHLCVNTGLLGIDGAADAIVTLARDRFETAVGS